MSIANNPTGGAGPSYFLYSGAGYIPIKAAHYSLCHGITPGTAVITTWPMDSLPEITGDLALVDGISGNVIQLYDFKVADVRQTRGSDGFTWYISLLDRRWRFQFGSLDGNYNVRRADNIIWNPTKLSPTDLVQQILQAMGERDADTSGFNPAQNYPQVDWQGSNPALELQNLVDLYGCRIILKIAGNLSIEPVGIGANIPTPDEIPCINFADTIDSPECPDLTVILGGQDRLQYDFLLYPVGIEEVDGSYQWFDQLSYAPHLPGAYGGWEFYDPNYPAPIFGGDGPSGRDERLEWLARNTIWRMYRPMGVFGPDGLCVFTDDSPLTTAALNAFLGDGSPYKPKIPRSQSQKTFWGVKATTLDLFLPLEVEQVDEMKPNIDRVDQADYRGLVNIPAWVFGIFHNTRGGYNNAQTLDPPEALGGIGTNEARQIIYGVSNYMPWLAAAHDIGSEFNQAGWNLDQERGIVHFSEPVYRIVKGENHYGEGGPIYVPALLVLRCACSPRDPTTFYRSQYRLTRIGNPIGQELLQTNERIINRPEIVHKRSAWYGLGYNSSGTTATTTQGPNGKQIGLALNDGNPSTEDIDPLTGQPSSSGGPPTDNQDLCDTEAGVIANAVLKQYQRPNPQQATYIGLHPIEPDGAIQQVIWHVGPQGATTEVSRNNETHPAIISYRQLKMLRGVSSLLERLAPGVQVTTQEVFRRPP